MQTPVPFDTGEQAERSTPMDAERRPWPATSAVVGAVLWVLAPLRQPVLEAGGHPDEGELVLVGHSLPDVTS